MIVKKIDRSSFDESNDSFAWAANLSAEEEFKASKLHYLIISKRETSRLYELPINEQAAIWKYAELMAEKALKQKDINSIAILVNDGIYAGQTIGHIHIHIVGFSSGEILNLNNNFRLLTKKYCNKENSPLKILSLNTNISKLYEGINSNFKDSLNNNYGLSIFSSKTISNIRDYSFEFTIELWAKDSPRNYGLTNLLRVMNGYKSKPYDWQPENKDAVFKKIKI